MDAPGTTLADIIEAREALQGSVRLTPVWPVPALAVSTGIPVAVKCEQMQITGSFKLRGALNFVRKLPAVRAEHGLVAASAGNHAQGVAYAARERGIPVTVVMPAGAPLAKVTAARELGAAVILHGESLEEARSEAADLADRKGWVFVPPFDDDDVIAGQGTVGLEILDQLPDVAEILVPAGGGGLLGGIALAVKSRRPDVRVVGVQSRAMSGICLSVEAGHPVHVAHERTIADGVAVAGPSERTFQLVSRYVDEMVSVGDEAIAHAIVLLIERAKLVAEGAGALAVAALQSGAYRPKGSALAVISGGNIDINLLGTIVHHGLVDAGRYQLLAIEVADLPGELALVAGAVADAGGSILKVEHVREAPDLPIGVAMLELVIEVNGPDHFADVRRSLRDRGLRASRGDARLATPSARQRHRQD